MCYEVMNLHERTDRYETRERGDVVRLLYTGLVLYLVLILQLNSWKITLVVLTATITSGL